MYLKIKIYSIFIITMNNCVRCGKTFSTKTNLTKHYHKKIPCNQYLNNLLPDSVKNVPNSILVSQNYQKGIIDSIKNTIPKVSQWNCEFCGNKFSHKNNYYRHKKQSCKFVKAKTTQDQLIKELVDKYDELKSENNNKISQLEDKIMEQQQIIEQITINGDQTNISGNQNINNGNIINNIMINNFGEEKINLTSAEVEQIMAAKYDMHKALIKKIHIDNPENRNFMIFSMKDKHAIIIKDGEKVYVNRIDAIDKFVTKA